jgi:hypothetical protein
MTSVYESSDDGFRARIAFAAAYILACRRTTRHFDTCFEMDDGHEVMAGILQRAAKNPKLAAALPRYLSGQPTDPEIAPLMALTRAQLVAHARATRNKAQALFNAKYPEAARPLEPEGVHT